MMVAMESMTPEELLARCDDRMRAVAEALRLVVRATLPDAIERVRPGWGLIGYDVPNGRRTAYCCFVWAEPEHVHLGFEHGVLMRDQRGMLQGRGVTKRVRWLTFTGVRGTNTAAVRALIHESARVATLSRDERLAIALDRELD
jgi:hypothetical protein